MNELQTTLNELLIDIQNATGKVIEFSADYIPDFVMRYVDYYIAANVIDLVLASIITIAVFILMVAIVQIGTNKDGVDNSPGCVIGCLLCIIMLLFSINAIRVNVKDIMKANYTPEIVVIEEINKLRE